MRKIKINETGMTGFLPEGYHELSSSSQIQLLKLAYSNPRSWEVKVDIWQRLMQGPKELKEILKRPENRDELWRLMGFLDWVWVGPTVLPIRYFKIRGKKYSLPNQDLSWITVGEFIVATAHLIGFSTAKDEAEARKSLGSFLATICRPKPDVMQQLRRNKAQWNGDPREEYNTYRCERRQELFGRVEESTAIGIMQWWNHAVTHLLKLHGLLDEKSDEVSVVSQGEFVRDWQKDVVLIAKKRVIGETIDKVYSRGIHEFFGFVNVEKTLGQEAQNESEME